MAFKDAVKNAKACAKKGKKGKSGKPSSGDMKSGKGKC